MAKTDTATKTVEAKATDEEAKPPRKRAFLPPQKKLAIQMAGLLAILGQVNIQSLLTEPQKAQVKAASDATEEINASTLKPLQDRIKAISEEFKALMPKISEPGTAEKAKALATELAQKQKRLETLTNAAVS